LQVQPRSAGGGMSGAGSGEWLTVVTPPDSLLVNIGDMLEKISGNTWRSTPHRVPAPDVPVGGKVSHNVSETASLNPSKNEDRLVLVLFVILAADFPVDEAGLTQGEYLFSHFKRWGRNASVNS